MARSCNWFVLPATVKTYAGGWAMHVATKIGVPRRCETSGRWCRQFRGIMGFLNHCLHKHGIKYKNEAAALTSTAATPVVRARVRARGHILSIRHVTFVPHRCLQPESKVPLDDRCRRVKRRHVQSNTVDSLTRAVRRRKVGCVVGMRRWW